MRWFLLWALAPICAFAQTPDIFDTARKGDVAAIERYAGDVNAVNDEGYSPFILATYYDHTIAAQALIKKGAEPCVLDPKGINAFMGMAFKGHVKTAEWMLANTKCDINHQNNAGQTALMMASLFGQDDVVALFVKRGADVNLVDAAGNTAESLAQGQGLTNIVDIIKFYRQ